MREIISRGKQTQLLFHMLAINTTGSLAFCTAAKREHQRSIIYASKRKLSDPTMPAHRAKAYSLFTEPFQRRMPSINQHLTAMLKRKEKFCWTGKNHCKTEQALFLNTCLREREKRRRGAMQTVFVNFAAATLLMNCKVAANGSGMASHSFLFPFFLKDPGWPPDIYWASKALMIAALCHYLLGNTCKCAENLLSS